MDHRRQLVAGYGEGFTYGLSSRLKHEVNHFNVFNHLNCRASFLNRLIC
jgi:hypothetical protein